MKVKLMILICLATIKLFGQNFNGLDLNLGNLYQISNAETRSISPENYKGEKGKGGMATIEEGIAGEAAKDLGQGWKVNPCVRIKPGETFTIAEIESSGAIQHIWMTGGGTWRFSILRMYWDDEKEPSIEVPLGDFFAAAYKYRPISSYPVCVNPGSAFNCYWVMPFKKKCKITVENRNVGAITLFYQIDYMLTDIPSNAAYFHAQFRRTNPLPYKEVYTIVDGIKGNGHFVGCYMFWQSNNNGWWGEGEIKFYMDGDKGFPTICGTGTEDYFCGSYNFENGETKAYQDFSTLYTGFHVFKPDGLYQSQTRFGMYRWHILDPVRFKKDLKITIQALGKRSNWRYMPLMEDISSVAYWYQTEPHAKFPDLADKEYLEIR